MAAFDELLRRLSDAGADFIVCAAEDLRAMKRAAGRTRDLADLEDLDAGGS